MILYDYDASTKEYLGYFEAPLDPLETIRQGKEVYAYPAHSTDIEPIEFREGYAIVFNGTGWEYVEDHRGLVMWDRDKKIVITALGPIPENYSLEKVLSLKELKENKEEEIKNIYNELYRGKVELYGVKVCLEDSSNIKRQIDAFGEYGSIVINEEEVVSTEEAKDIVKYLYIRSMLLLKRKKELLNKVASCKKEEDVKALEVSFDINVDEFMGYSVEEIKEKLK